MSSILPFACGPHPVWSPMANEIHAAIWDRVGLGKVQGFVREWASDWNAGVNAAEAASQEKFARARQALHYPEDSTLNLIADNLPDDWQLKEALWEPVLPELPLPPSHRERSPAEKWAALAAVHDVFDLTGDKVLPWPLPEDDQDLVALTEWMRGEGGSYLVLMRAASALTDTEADPVGRWLEDVKKGGGPAAEPAADGGDDGWVLVSELWPSRPEFKRANQVTRFLDKLPNKPAPEGIRNRKEGQRRYVHEADWHRYFREKDRLASEALDDESLQEKLADIEARKLTEAANKHGK